MALSSFGLAPSNSPLVAISLGDLKQWGCPSCGYRFGRSPVIFKSTALWKCDECRKGCLICLHGIVQAAFAGPDEDGVISLPLGDVTEGDLPLVSIHPRQGTPFHTHASSALAPQEDDVLFDD